MHLSTHLGWQNVDLASDLRKQIALPIRIMNNVRAAALLSVQQLNLPAESGHFYLRIAEGIGGALVQHGVVFTGNSWTAGEAGHLTVQPNGPRCSCNRQGCLEAMISKPAINQQLAQRQPGLTWHSRDSAPNVVNEVMQLAGNYLGIALSQIMLLLNPATIIIDCPWSISPTFCQAVLNQTQANKLAFIAAHTQVHFLQSHLAPATGLALAIIEQMEQRLE